MSAFATASVPASRDLRNLCYVEHFLVWALRTSVACSPQCRTLLREFSHAFGPEMTRGEAAYHDWLIALCRGKRTLDIGRPGMIEITTDEASLLSLLAAAQDQDEALFLARARWLMGAEPEQRLYEAGCHLMALLGSRGHLIPRQAVTVVAEIPRNEKRVHRIP
jgi:hypothetical protein